MRFAALSPQLRGGLVGVVSGACALGAAEVVAAFVRPVSSPVLAVGAAAVDLTPEWLKEFAIRSFGTNDKLVLLSGVGIVVALLCVAAGLLAARSAPAGTATVGALGALAAAAAVSRPDSNISDLLPSATAFVVGSLVLRVLSRRSHCSAVSVRGGADVSRRSFVGAVAAAGALAAVSGSVGRVVGSRRRDVSASRAAVKLPPPLASAAPVPEQLTVPGLTPFVTPANDFYRIDTALVVPRVAAETWKLRIHGEVDNAMEISFAELSARPLIERWITMACVSNEIGGRLVGNARWLGAPIADLLREAKPRAGADMVLSTSTDGWTASTPLPVLLDGRDAMLAIAMNGAPLPVRHGFPVRMVVPGLYGYVSGTKWVVDLEVMRFGDRQAYWTERGWSENGPIKTQSRIDVPGSGDTVKAGKVTVAGVAWAQHRGIKGVEVRIDDGEWSPARVAGVPSIDTWCQWLWEWNAVPGSYVLEVRATDGTGETQTSDRTSVAPDGATGWHQIGVLVV